MDGEFRLVRLQKEFVESHLDDILRLVNLVSGSCWDVGRFWRIFDHNLQDSLAITHKQDVVALPLAYWHGALGKLHLAKKHIFIRRLCVVGEFRGRNLASALVRELAKNVPDKTLIALQTAKNNALSNGLYSHLGFRLLATTHIDGHEDNIWTAKKEDIT